MKRREFLKITTPLAAAPLFLNAIPVKTFATKKMVASLDCIDTNDRVLVVIFLGGANDGVNTIIPIEQYDYYANVRPSLRISDSGTKAYHTLDSSLTGMDAVGLHPTLTAMKAMYEKGMLNIVQGVGYPSINRSHFRSTDLWLKGSDGIMEHADGWIGRYFESRYPDAVNGPTSAQPDPLGIQLGGSTLSLGFHTQEQDAVALTLAGQDPSGFLPISVKLGVCHLIPFRIQTMAGNWSFWSDSKKIPGSLQHAYLRFSMAVRTWLLIRIISWPINLKRWPA